MQINEVAVGVDPFISRTFRIFCSYALICGRLEYP